MIKKVMIFVSIVIIIIILMSVYFVPFMNSITIMQLDTDNTGYNFTKGIILFNDYYWVVLLIIGLLMFKNDLFKLFKK